MVLVSLLLPRFLREDLSPVSEATLEENRQRWRSQSIRDYDVRFVKQADRMQDEVYAARVRSGQVVRLERNGSKLPRPSAAYGIEGLFDTIQRELEMANTNGEGPRRGSLLRARFHRDLGVPEVFQVIVSKGVSFRITLEEVTVPGRGRIFP
ncbi:MAG: DUF6174 domain-containing protein [Planctomycetota bacterium]|nr:DUF6174 domain-containing protein [Planctomycetota bacterium]